MKKVMNVETFGGLQPFKTIAILGRQLKSLGAACWSAQERGQKSIQNLLREQLLGWLDGVYRAKLFCSGRPFRVYDLVNAGPRHRFCTAQFVVSNCLGLGYGCGWKKFIAVAQTLAGLDITVDDPETVPALNEFGDQCIGKDGKPIFESGYGLNSRRIVKEYREQNPLITGLWNRLDEEFRNSVGGDFSMTLPSGRVMRYPEVRRGRRAIVDPENPKKITHRWETTALNFDQKYNRVVRKSIYGGLLAENCCQATARDVFGEIVIELAEKAGIDVLFTAHDEAVNEVDTCITKKDVEHIMSQCPEWMQGLPVSTEVVESQCYLK